jgi:hypothetical protein
MVHPGALKEAIRLLRRWSDAMQTPVSVEYIGDLATKSRDAARALMRDLRTWERRLHRSVKGAKGRTVKKPRRRRA